MTAGAITDVAGIRVGHWTDARALTGCTVVLAEAGAAPGVSVRGGAPGTIETDALRPGATVQVAHAILLTGGSAYGLAAAAGVMRWLEERGVGIRVDRAIVPIVAGAVIFDLLVGDGRVRPGPDAGYAACAAAGAQVEEGRVGAGTGATWGKLRGREHARPGGVGTASVKVGEATVGAIFVVNAVGEVYGEDGLVIGGPIPGEPLADPGLGHTTIGVVATDAAISKSDANRL
ncbi:MAG TPA: P1 family peptidase, partial [Candidatus Limnocylindrales bacterium]|nr:P1 family peptidase [Candidatus Limnocylindrales bacterium]